MSTHRSSNRVQRMVAVLVCLVGVTWLGTVHATLVSPVSVSLFKPGGIVGDPSLDATLTDSVAIADGIDAGDASNIGSFMLQGEYIKFGANFIEARVSAGARDGQNRLVTGYLGAGGDHARYQFDGVAVQGADITGISAQVTGGTGLDIAPVPLAQLVDPDTITLDLDEMVFAFVQGLGDSEHFAVFRIDLQTRQQCSPTDPGCGNPNPTPEPSSLALLLAGLVAARRGWRGRAGR